MARLELARLPETQPPSFQTIKPLPILSVNHISFAVPSPIATSKFFQSTLGFRSLPQPDIAAFRTSEWLCGMGLEIHFVKRQAISERLRQVDLDPRNDHISFLCPDTGLGSPWGRVVDMLEASDVHFIERQFPDINMRQVCAHYLHSHNVIVVVLTKFASCLHFIAVFFRSHERYSNRD